MLNSLKNYVTNYVKWWWQTTCGQNKNDQPANQYDGLTSFVISVILLTISFKSLYDTILNFLANMFISAPADTTLDQFGTHTVNYLGSFRHEDLFSGLIITALSFIILIGISWLICRKVSRKPFQVKEYLNQLAASTNGALCLELIGMLLAFVGHGFKLVVVLDIIATIIYQLGTIDLLWRFHFKSRQLRLYVSTLMVCLYPVAFLIILNLLILSSR